jgi:hypothetical protein
MSHEQFAEFVDNDVVCVAVVDVDFRHHAGCVTDGCVVGCSVCLGISTIPDAKKVEDEAELRIARSNLSLFPREKALTTK